MRVPNAAFFQTIGLLAVPGFLDADWRERVRDAMDRGRRAEGTVGSDGPDYVVDPAYRRTKVVDVGDELRAAMKARLMELAPALSAHYKVPLTDCQRPQFLSYGPGDFYKAHRDGSASPTGAALSTSRRISAVIFLNEQSETPGPESFGGGALTFYELFDDPAARNLGIPLDPEPGLLITFGADVLHAVAPVTHGERRTIVSWYV